MRQLIDQIISIERVHRDNCQVLVKSGILKKAVSRLEMPPLTQHIGELIPVVIGSEEAETRSLFIGMHTFSLDEDRMKLVHVGFKTSGVETGVNSFSDDECKVVNSLFENLVSVVAIEAPAYNPETGRYKFSI